MDRTTPPSTRSAAPLIAEARGLQTKATTPRLLPAWRSAVGSKWAGLGKNSFRPRRDPPAFGEPVDEIVDALGRGRSGEHGVDGDGRARGGFGEAAGDGELGGLGHAVVDHFHGDLESRFTGDEDDASPVLLLIGPSNAGSDGHR